MQGIEQISDLQLYALNRNEVFRGQLLQIISDEYQRRAFADAYVEQLRAGYDKRSIASSAGLSFIHKVLIAITAPTLPFNIIVMLYYAKGNKTIQKQFWNCLIAGHAMWIIIALVLERYLPG